jgi:hypothetical protein
MALLALAVVLPVLGGCAQLTAESRLALYAAGDEPDTRGILAQMAAFKPDLIVEIASVNTEPRWISPDTLAPMTGSSCAPEQFCIHFIDNGEPITQDSDEWLLALDRLSTEEKLWKIVFLSRPIFDPGMGRIDRKQLPLAELLAREEVNIAFVPGGGQYVRTARIGPTVLQSVQYVSLPLSEDATPVLVPPWVSRIVPRRCYGYLSADKWFLRWEVTGLEGGLLDELDIPANAPGAYAPKLFSISEMLAIEREIHGGKVETPSDAPSR